MNASGTRYRLQTPGGAQASELECLNAQASVSHVPTVSCTRLIRWIGRGATHPPVLPLQPTRVHETV